MTQLLESDADTARPPSASFEPRQVETDDDAWDAFVASTRQATWLQTTPWARVKRANGWSAVRAAASFSEGGEQGTVGAQVLVRRVSGLPWGLGYIPRGPVGLPRDPLAAGRVLALLTDRLREVAREHRLANVRMEPEVVSGEGVEQALERIGWRSTRRIQQRLTRIVNLDRPEEEVWQGLHRKARQSVTKARRLGVRVVTADGSRLDDYYRVYTDAAGRAAMFARTLESFRLLWDELAPRGMAHLSFAEFEESGEPVATLLLTSCGDRIFDMYGGTTPAGEARRANYLLKWEALARSRAAGFREYDLWGLPHPGIARFKAGFGGEEVDYLGAWQMGFDRIGNGILSAGLAARSAALFVRHRGKGVWEGQAGVGSGGD
jgi:lipid II:glycine glycyltransferase (peptidoglycan interpeptide bridge formation enzyme)